MEFDGPNMNLNEPHIAIIAPGGYAPDENAFKRGVATLEGQGSIVKSLYDFAAKYQRFGATDSERAAQFNAAAEDELTQIVMALRGGYGMTRLLSLLDFQKLADSGKLFVGHSDFTAFQMALLALTGAISFAGPMLCDDFTREDSSDFTFQHFWQCFSHPTHKVEWPAENNPVISEAGILWGGNLAMLTHLVGTPFLPKIDGGILFVEDVNEHPYRVERMMMQLLHAGVLERQKAIVFGDFSNYRLTDYDNGYDFNAMLAYLRSQLSMPLLTGLPFGHIRNKTTLPVGCQAELVCDGSHIQLTMSGYPNLGSLQSI